MLTNDLYHQFIIDFDASNSFKNRALTNIQNQNLFFYYLALDCFSIPLRNRHVLTVLTVERAISFITQKLNTLTNRS